MEGKKQPMKEIKSSDGQHESSFYIKDALDALNQLIRAHNEGLEPVKPAKRRWRAEKRGQYYFIYSYGVISTETDIYSNVDNFHYRTGNYYQTKELAEAALERIETEAQLRELSEQAWGDVEIDWESSDRQLKWVASATVVGLSYYATSTTKTANQIYFPSEESLKAAVTTIGKDKVIRYIKGGV